LAIIFSKKGLGMKISLLNTSLILITTAVIFTGCANHSTYYKSSVVEYLYPNQKDTPVIQTKDTQIPVLTLPAKIGIAFIPDSKTSSGAGMSAAAESALTEKEKSELLKDISEHFKKYNFIQSIDIIPSSYLTKGGSFNNLDQIHSMYGVDIIALISYDQAQFTDEGQASISYWTLVGAYFVKGEKNATHTMTNAAVFDIISRKMLFNATGTSIIKSEATPINLSEQMRKDSASGLSISTKQLIDNLDEQLQLFREKVKNSPEEYHVVKKPK
jgi:rhombotail lipoprotein